MLALKTMKQSLHKIVGGVVRPMIVTGRGFYSATFPVFTSMVTKSALLKGGLASSVFLGGIYGTITLSEGESDSLKDVLPLGGVSKDGDRNLLYIPGSISNANITGSRFSELFFKETGVRPRYVNSQMDLSEYPAQYFNLDQANKRNAIVESSVSSVIADGVDDVTIIAHSAGSHSAIAATRAYYEAHPDSTKKVTIMLAGAGSPDSTFAREFELLAKNDRVKIQEFRNELDLVPSIGGTVNREGIVYFASPHSQTAITTIQSALEQEPTEHHDVPSILNIKAFMAMATAHQAHWCTEYVPIVGKYYLENKRSDVTQRVRLMREHHAQDTLSSPSSSPVTTHNISNISLS